MGRIVVGAVLLALVAAAWFAFSAFGAPPLPAPVITAGSKPANPTAAVSGTFQFTDTQSVTFQCSLDAIAFANCFAHGPGTSGSQPYGPLAAGSHTFQVRAVSGANTSSATSYTWVIDTTPPTVSVTFPGNGGVYKASTYNAGCSPTGICGTAADPSGVGSVRVSVKRNSTGKYWNGSGFNNASETFNAASGTTSWKYALALPPDDVYVVHVQATDSLGNTQSAGVYAANLSFTIDTTPPGAPSITAPAASPAWTTTTSPNATWTGAEAGGTFMCKLDSGSFSACTSPKNYPGLSQGSYTFQVEQVDAAGNVGAAASRTFRIDTVPPNAPSIQSAPFAWPPIGWASTNATFAFNDSSSDVTGYMCKLDAGVYGGCFSPQPYSALAQGQHTFKVKAVDGAGNQSGETSWTFFVDTINPNQPTLTGNPTNPSSSQSATFSWTDTDPGYPTTGTGIAGYLCRLDSGFWQICSSSKTYNSLSFSSHTFQVVAVDWAGNTSTARSYTWTVSNTTGLPFTIGVASTIGLLNPSGTDVKLNLVFTNPNGSPITVNSLDITVTGTDTATCPLSLAKVTVSKAFTGPIGPIPAHSTGTSLSDLGLDPSTWPRLHMADNGDQTNCEGIHVNLSFTNGQATG